MTSFRRVLVTGATSGLGKGFLDFYSRAGAQVICVNRRSDAALSAAYPSARVETLDITDPRAVKDLLQKLNADGAMPDLFVLSAGINCPDNFSGLDYASFHEVMRTNLDGVMTFVGAIAELGIQGKTIVGMSSTSNIVANPAHIAYHVSKWSIKRCFELISQSDPHNTYKTVVLGPVHTNIMARYPQPQGVQKRLFELMAVQVPETIAACDRFFRSPRRVLNYPLWVYFFYYFIKTVLAIFPGIYRGTRRKSEQTVP